MTGPNEPQWGQPGQQDRNWRPDQVGQWGPPTGGQPEQPSVPQPWGQPPAAQPAPGWNPPTGGQPGNPQPGQAWNPQPGAQPWHPQTGGQPWNPQTGGQPGQPWNPQPGSQPGQGWNPQPGSQPWNPQTGGQPGQAWNPQNGAQPGQPWGPQYGSPGGQPPKKGNKGVIITAVAVVVALVAGLGVWFFAFRDSKPAGKDTPQQAAAQLFADISNGDMVGLADTFDPVEAGFVNDLAADVLTHFKRLGLLTDSATVGNSTGSTISIKGITFDDAAAEKPLADLTIVKLTGGTVTITPSSTSANETDLFTKLKNALGKYAQSNGAAAGMSTAPTVIDIAKTIKDDLGGKPIRISTVLRDGSWYPSMFYTLADYWAQDANLGPVTAADAVPAAGKGSPEDAVNAMLAAALKQNAADMIALLPPDEMAAVHAYGQKLITSAGSGTVSTSGVAIDATWATTEVTGGTLVSVKTLNVTMDSKTVKISVDKDAGTMTIIDADNASKTIDANSVGDLIGTDLTSVHPNMPDFVGRMIKAALGMGFVTTKAGDGNWYVSPARTTTGVFTTLLGGMEQRDIQMFIDLLDK